MIDPEYLLCVGDVRAQEMPALSSGSFSAIDVYNFNPLEELCLPGQTPSGCYELQSVMNVFSPIYEQRIISNIECVFMDLDTGEGCLMAMQGRYPNSKQYSLSTKILSPEGGIERSRVDAVATSPEGLAVLCRQRNLRGISLAYTCQTDSEDDTVRRVLACVSCLSMIGTMCAKVDNYSSTLARDLWLFLAERFSEISLYKPAVLSCVKRGCLIVCSARYPDSNVLPEYIVPVLTIGCDDSGGRLTSRTVDGSVVSSDYPDPETEPPVKRRVDPLVLLNQHIAVLESYRWGALESISRRVNNKNACDISQHIERYRGMG